MSIMSRQERYLFLTSIKRTKGTDRIKPEFANYVITQGDEVLSKVFYDEPGSPYDVRNFVLTGKMSLI